MQTSSAAPSTLFRYADTGNALNDRLLFESRHLGSALDRFVATCTEYQIGVDRSLAERLADYSRQTGVADQWVRRVGEAFLLADSGTVTGSAWRAAAEGQASAARAGAAVRDAAGWLLGASSRAAGVQARAALATIGRLANQIVSRLGAIGRATGDKREFTVCDPTRREGTSLGTRIGGWIDWAGGMLGNLLSRVREAFTSLLRQALGIAEGIMGLARRLTTGAIRIVQQATNWVMAALVTTGQAIWNGTTAFAKGVGDALVGTGKALWSGTIAVTKSIGNFFVGAGNAIWDKATAFGNWVMDGVHWLGNRIGDFVRALSDGFKQAIRIITTSVKILVLVADILKPIIANTVQQAVKWLVNQTISIVKSSLHFAWDVIQKIYWKSVALRLTILLGAVQVAQYLLGDKWWIGAVVLGLVNLEVIAELGIDILFLLGSQTLGDLASNPRQINDPLDILDLLHQNFWNLSFKHLDPTTIRRLAVQFENVMRQARPGHQNVRTIPEELFSDRTLNVSAQDVFLLDKDGNLRGTQAGTYRDDGTIELDPSVIQSGPHSLISGNMGEQVTMARVGSDEYAFGVDGLDPENMGNSPNGIVSVIDTAYFDPNQNKYYQLVKERFGDYLRNVPPGSKLNFVGHSMGAGMLMILLNDPEIQQKIKERGYDVHSVTTYGMVRPTDPSRNDVPPDTSGSGTTPAIFSETKVRHYVDPDDKLAMNVGGGHEGRANVKLVDDGEITGPVEAHTTYYRKDYKGEPLPFTVDPKQFKLYIRGGEPPLPDPTPPPANMA